MANNRINSTIPPEVLAQVNAKLGEIKTLLLPYLQSLTIEERRDLPKMSNKTLSFVSKVTDYCSTNPEFCPSYLSTTELNADYQLAAQLKPVLDLCEQLCSNVDDTLMLAGSEAYTASLMYYGSVQAAAKTGQAGARPIYEDLQQRFARKPKAEPAG